MYNIGIYKIKNIKNNKEYIGSSLNIEKRWKRHINKLNKNKHDNLYLQREWNKYTEKYFIFEIIELCEKEKLLDIEQKYLNYIFENNNHFEFYYNIGKKSSGGDNITKNPNRQEIIKNISNSNKKRYDNMTDNEKRILSEKNMGENNPNFNNKWNNEQKENVSNKLKKYYENNPNYIKGKTFEEYYGLDIAIKKKQKISEYRKTLIGEKNPFFNKKHTQETKENISKKRMGKISDLNQCIPFKIDNDIFISLSDASKKLNIHITIRHRLNSKNSKFDNYQYIRDDEFIEKLKKEYKEKMGL